MTRRAPQRLSVGGLLALGAGAILMKTHPDATAAAFHDVVTPISEWLAASFTPGSA